ncbi:MAG: 50S ribosomal protein L6 [Candidatus Micrarchaeia archaeon]
MMKVKIPESAKIEVEGNTIITSGALGKNRRIFNANLLSATVSGNTLTINGIGGKKLAKKARTAEIALAKEVQNDINGVSKYYEINMKGVFAHFPLSIEVKNGSVYINNLFGERVPRIAKIVGDTKAETTGQGLIIRGTSLDDVTQSAANVRKACRIKDKDIRVFQDGVYHAEV